MKKSLFIIAAIALAGIVKAQSFLVTELVGGNAANSHYVINTDTTNHASPMEMMEFKIQNTSASTETIRIRKTIISNAAGQDIYFCYNIICYNPSTYTSAANIAAGQALPNGNGSYGLRAEFDANLNVGTSIVRYTIYDSTTNINDSVNITITYNVAGVTGIKNISNNVFISNPVPNPASNIVNFTYDLGSANTDATIKIYNTLGNLVKSVSLNPAMKNAQVDVSTLEEGFYFYTIIANGKAVSTKRLVIAR